MKKGKYHFIGIGGIGMGALANLLLDKGCHVSGSDIKEGRLTKQLAKRGAEIVLGHDQENIGDQDYVIYSSAIKKDNPEILAAKELGIPLLKRAELLAELMEEQVSITVAGAHGKTTTTSLISHILDQCGLKPSCAIGGIVRGAELHAQIGSGEYFVTEVDESDGTFLKFHPQYSIITNIDLEHVDFYQNWENVISSYKKFISHTNQDGLIIYCGDDEKLSELVAESGKTYTSYGFNRDNDVQAINIQNDQFESRFDYIYKGKTYGTVKINTPGNHNILNSLAAITLALEVGCSFDEIRQALEKFKGVCRRLDLKGEVNRIKIIDDYAHHPAEIRAVLDTVKEMTNGQMVVVVQPHRYSRLQFLFNEFIDCLKGVNRLYITDVYAASEKEIPDVNAKKLVDNIQNCSKGAVKYVPHDKLCSTLVDAVKPGDTVLTLGAGDITYLADEILRLLENTTHE